ncbi:Cytochrome P450 [Actinokineospora iranica]|uniref:Cytochrome P450 n=1 Tax=Actinokineospora iranica TaxID=1271860 RepID=A0A1G6W770_9PSEU|nr:Cytochrome P450 [Actinokineospora iranica]
MYPFGEITGLEVDPVFAQLRESEPLARVRLPYEGEGWLVTRYADVKLVNSDPRFTRAHVGDGIPRTTPLPRRGDSILGMDPPEHTRLRKLVSKAFTARRIGRLRPRIERIANVLLDRVERDGPPADLMDGVSLPLTITVICELLGVPYHDQGKFRHWTDAVMATTAYDPDEAQRCEIALRGYLARLVADHRENTYDDLLGHLVGARDEDEKLSEQELVSFGVTLLISGHETTANQIGNFTYVLLTNPHIIDALRADRALLPSAIEELLRFVPMGNGIGNARIAKEDVELSGGVVRAGEAVFAAGVNANRDRRVFTDPDRLDIHRADNPHLAFGHGPHYCLGAQLARMELAVVLDALLDRFPSLALAVPAAEVPWKQGRLLRGPESLPVQW